MANIIVSSPPDNINIGNPTEPVITAPVGTATFNGWTINCKESHILKSKCSKSKEGCEKDDPNPCSFCLFSNQLELPHLPDMVFPDNVLQVIHNESNFIIEFNALDALKLVSTEKHSVKIACADDWIASRADDPNIEKVAHPFDWTFSTNYAGTLKNGLVAEATDKRMDMAKLAQREQILYYREVTLYEDELHDNGTVTVSIKIRVMPSGFYVLLRMFLRVDGVMVRVIDTRYHHEFGNTYVLREYTEMESPLEQLQVPTSALTDPNEVVPLLPVKTKKHEILRL